MISTKAFIIGIALIGFGTIIYSLMKTSSDCSRQEEIEAWEEEHRKDRDGSGV